MLYHKTRGRHRKACKLTIIMPCSRLILSIPHHRRHQLKHHLHVSDALAKNGPLQWNEYDSSSNGGCVFTAGTYHVKEYATGYFQPCFAQAGNFSNFTLQVQMTILSGEYGGIIFRADNQNSKFYLL